MGRCGGWYAMSDQEIAGIARELAYAMATRARTRLPEDNKRVLLLQTDLVRAVAAEEPAEERTE